MVTLPASDSLSRRKVLIRSSRYSASLVVGRPVREGRERGREGEREGGREGREGEREGGREGGREGREKMEGREGKR